MLADPHTPRRAPAPHLPTAAPWPPPHADGVMLAQGSRSDERRCRAQRRRKAAAREAREQYVTFAQKPHLEGVKKSKVSREPSASAGGPVAVCTRRASYLPPSRSHAPNTINASALNVAGGPTVDQDDTSFGEVTEEELAEAEAEAEADKRREKERK